MGFYRLNERMATSFYFVRHGESTANVDGVSAGWSDVPLTTKGWQQANEVANLIREENLQFDRIFSSPLVRALDTAKVIARANNIPGSKIAILPELKEKSSGSLELRPLHEVFDTTEERFRELGGENAEMFQERTERAIQSIIEQSKGLGAILIVAHSGTYKMMDVIKDGLSPATRMYEVEIPKNAAILKISL